MSIYTRATTAAHNQFTQIANAYTTAGLTPPSKGDEIRQHINTAPDVRTVAVNIARTALDTADPDTWHAQAIEQLQQAHAAQALRDAFNSTYTAELNRRLPGYLRTAATDLDAFAAKQFKDLENASKKLPEGTNALDANALLEADAGKAYTTVKQALTHLATLASMHRTEHYESVSQGLASILPLIELPNVVQEIKARSIGETAPTQNPEHLNNTKTVRRLNDEAKHNIDLTLVDIARGNYEGVTLHLNNQDQVLEQAARVRLAHTIRYAGPNENAMISL